MSDIRLDIKVIARSKRPGIFVTGENQLTVRVSAPADQGKANKELIKRLAEHFDVAQNQIEITRGLTSNHKRVRLNC